MIVDGHAIRRESIDAVTEIETKVDGAYEGTDKIARGHFDILIHGQRITISRSTRFASNDEPLRKRSIQFVFDTLTVLRNPIVDAFR